MTSAVPQVAHTSVAVVISKPNSSSIMPPIALPSRRRSSATGRSETLGLDRERRVAKGDKPIGCGIDEPRRPADENMRLLGGGPGDFLQHLVVDPPGIARPPGRVTPGKCVKDLDPVAAAVLELLPVDDVLERSRRVEQAHRCQAGRGADHRHQRHHPGAPADEEDRPPVVHPDEVAADRPTHLEAVTFTRDLDEVGGYLAVLELLDRDLQRLAGRRGDRIAALGLVAVVRCQPDVEVLAGPMAGPAFRLDDQRPNARRLRDPTRYSGGEPR